MSLEGVRVKFSVIVILSSGITIKGEGGAQDVHQSGGGTQIH